MCVHVDVHLQSVCVCVFVEEASLPTVKDSSWDTHLIEMNRFLDSGIRRRRKVECGVAAGGLICHHTHTHKTHTHRDWLSGSLIHLSTIGTTRQQANPKTEAKR